MNHFIQIYSSIGFDNQIRLDYVEHWPQYSEVVDINWLNFQLSDDGESIVDKICRAIRSLSYISVYTDEYYIPGKGSYHKQHYVRQLLIYGFDPDKKKFYCLGYTSYKNPNNPGYFGFDYFDKEIISFNDMTIAYDGAKIHYKTSAPWAERYFLYFFTTIAKKREYPFNLNLFKQSIIEYIHSVPDHGKEAYQLEQTTYNHDFSYGIKVYDSLISVLRKNLLENESPLDYFCLYLLKEHKKVILKRLLYIQKKYRINIENQIIQFQKIDKVINGLYLNYLKHQIRPKNEIIEKTIHSLSIIKSEEPLILKQIVETLDKIVST